MLIQIMSKFVLTVAVLLLLAPGGWAFEVKDRSIDMTTDTTPQLGGNLDLNGNEITVKATEFLPISAAVDGASAPAVAGLVTSTNKIMARAFDGAANEDVQFAWQVPFDFTGSTISFNVVNYAAAATPPHGTIAAQGTITMSGVATADETFVVGAQTFTWKAARAAAGEVTIGADAPAAVANIVTAITADLATVTAVDGAGDTVVITAATAGTAGNSIIFTENSTNMAVDGAGTLGTTTAGEDAEVIAFSLACVSQTNSEILSGALGTAATSSLTADNTYVQYDRLATTYSSAVTPSGSITAGETAICTLTRLATTTDTYAQDLSVAGINIKYSRALTND